MRIAVLGAGAVGGTLAALLDRAGHEVAVTARGAHLAAIAERGLSLRGGWGEHVARIPAAERLDRSPELAIVATKAQDAGGAIAAGAELLAGVPLVIVQNGLSGIDSAAASAPSSPLIGGLALFAASHLEPGLVEVTAPGALLLAPGSRGAGAALALAARALAPLLPVQLGDDLRAAQWSKLLVNQVNALPAVTGLSVQATVAHTGLLRVLTRSMQEAARVAAASGARFAPLGVVDERAVAALRTLPTALAAALPRRMARSMGDVPNPGSTLQSVRRGVPTEIDHLNGAIVDAARSAGLQAPVNAAITAMVHEAAARGFLSPDEVVARIAAIDAPQTRLGALARRLGGARG
ncbi:ketopantoate reductase family protein [Arenivirga flava]|uniref:2-dehydropantoate 2-reductase n=1 Tax=Arenivirga flava TaxID=1930060 RepID=A0AA37UEX3_9MICO|nr:2-dehydropantoate 2-reductase [Arenivirga flava]GMA27769.1 2-dehydropantoate 2-reductase [Arenivirga flava]